MRELLLCVTLFVRWVYTTSCDGCLMLTPYIDNLQIEVAKNLSKVDPGRFQGVSSYSGYITVDKQKNSNLFFWFFPMPSELIEDKPWIIWLQGGPGYSSLVGLFELIGPLEVKNGEVHLRNVTWASDYSLLFLDNPVGAGFSFTDDDNAYPDNEDDVGAQMYEFLSQFLKLFPELRRAPLFIAGESYAGKYVPALAIQIHKHNDRNESSINFKGVAIGNGLIDPRSMLHYSELCGALGLLEDEALEQLQQLERIVVKLIDAGAMVDAANQFNETVEFIKKHSGVDVYNFNKDPNNSTLQFEEFVKRSDVRAWIHAGTGTFDLNNQVVYNKMLPDIMNTTKPWVEELLEHYAVMSYSGQLDIIIGYSLSKHMYKELNWSRRKEYLDAPRRRLRSHENGSVVGYKKAGGNFVEVLVRGAGHMVPKDQPEIAKFVIDAFIDEFK